MVSGSIILAQMMTGKHQDGEIGDGLMGTIIGNDGDGDGMMMMMMMMRQWQ
jgi:hypothetical protein